jgi:hypothetical protein
MALFGIGGGKETQSARSSSNAQSTDWSQQLANAFGINSSQGSTFVDPAQAGARQGLFDQILKQMGGAGAAEAGAQATLGGILPGLQSTFSALGGMTDPSATIKAQGSALSEGLGNLFRQEIMPGIKGDAIAAGGFGGGRQGVAEGVAAGQLGQSYTQGLADITAAANNQALQAAQVQQAMGTSIFDLSQAGSTAGLGWLESLAGILGPTTTLSSTSSSGVTGSTSSGASQGQSTSESESLSRGSGSKWNLGF